jgi:callose synthase
MRNLLEEFDKRHGVRKPTILGVREHVFTGSVSSLAWFMSAQETSFVTLGQRVLANPLKIRMHYGHPDVFNRLWFMSRGGISKASRTINISEDIFAGFNCTQRGGTVTHHEYIQVPFLLLYLLLAGLLDSTCCIELTTLYASMPSVSIYIYISIYMCI